MARLEVRVQAIVLVGGRLLLARHVKRDRRYWVLPGGHRENGETLLEALARELDEEAGIRPKRASLFSLSEVLLPKREILDVVFRVGSFDGTPRLGRVSPSSTDRRLAALELRTAEELRDLDFRPAGLRTRILETWEAGRWEGVGYLGDLHEERPG